MLVLALSLLIVGYAAGAPPVLPVGTCNNNHQLLTEEEVVTNLANTVDYNNDGYIQEAEVVVAFAEILDIHLPLPPVTILGMDYNSLINLANLFGVELSKHDFVNGWHSAFHDSIPFIRAVFDEFDTNNDDVLSMVELDNVILNMKADFNNPTVITKQQFYDYFMAIYVSGCH